MSKSTFGRIGLRRALLTLFGLLFLGTALVIASSVFAASTAITAGACTAYVDTTANTTLSQSGNDCILTFKASTSATNSGETTNTAFTPAPGVTNIRVLLVGGGAGGDRGLCGYYWGHGGGGGAVFDSANYSSSFPKFSSLNEYIISVGRGGNGGGACTSPGSLGKAGGNTTISGTFVSNSFAWANAVAEGGQPAVSNAIAPTYAGRNGGSSGRERKNTTTDLTVSKAGGIGAGGISGCGAGGNYCSAGSGGGAGGAGNGITGGAGLGSNIVSGTTVYYGMGGAGAQDNSPGAVYSASSNTVAAAPTSCLGADETGSGGSDCAKAGGGASTDIGGEGGSGLAVLRYALPTLSISTAGNGAISGSAMLLQPIVQINDNNGAALTGQSIVVTASAGAGCTLTNNTATTDSTTGLATFSNLIITGNLGTSCTLAYAATGFVSTSQSAIGIKKIPENIDVSSSATESTGLFINGTFYTGSTGLVNVNVSDLASQLVAGDFTLQASSTSSSDGNIVFRSTASLIPSTSAARTLNLRASRNIDLISGSKISTSGQALNLIFTSDTNDVNGGAVFIAGSGGDYVLDTNGGHIHIAGGSTISGTLFNGLTVPSGESKGDARYANRGWGVEFSGAGTSLPFIRTDGGNLKVRASINSQASNPSYSSITDARGISFSGANVNLGVGTLNLHAYGAPVMSSSSSSNAGLAFVNSTITGSGITALGRTASGAGTSQAILISGVVNLSAGSSGTVTLMDQSSTSTMKLAGTLNVTGNLNVNASSTTSTFSGTVSVSGNFSAPDSNTFTTSGSITAEGTISITADAGTMTIGGDLVASSSGKSITLKATADILHNSGAITTQAGSVTFWSDSDATSGGGIQTGRGTSINTNGGALTMSGGTNTSTGYAKGTANSSHRGVNMQGSISTGAGNIILRGEDAATEGAAGGNWGAGVLLNDDASIATTSGTVTITGLTNSDNTSYSHRHAGVMIGFSYFGGVNQTSYADATITTGSGSISLNGSVASGSTYHRYGVMFYQSSVSSTSGDISVQASNSRSDYYDLDFGYSSVGNRISTGGNVTITGDTTSAGSYFSGSTISAGGALTLNVNKPTFTSMTLNGAGSKIIQHPTSATNFGAAVDITGVSFASTSTTLTVGRSGVTPNQTVTLGNANTSIAGNITVYGAAITQSGAVATTSGGNVTYSGAGTYSQSGALTSAGTISQTGGTTVSVTGATQAAGAISYTGSGAVSNGTNGTIQSTGSSVSLTSTGSTMALAKNVTAATSVSISQTGTYSGAGALTASGGTLSISGGTSVAPTGTIAASGNITISGSGAITNTGATITSSTGTVSVTSTGSSISMGSAVSGAVVRMLPNTTYDGAGSLTASSGTLSITGGTTVSPTGNFTSSGDMTLSGSGRLTLSSMTASVSGSGSITLTGGTLASTNGGLEIYASNITTTTGVINITGNASASWGFNIWNASKVQSTSGAINITGNTPSDVWGGYFQNADIISSSGAITAIGGGYGVVTGHNGATEFGALSNTTSSSSITVRGNRYWESNTAVTYKTSGAVVIESVADLFTADTTIQNATFTGNSSLRIGKSTNTRSMTVSGSVSIAGNYQVYGAGITQSAPVTTSNSGNITFIGAGAFANSGALTAGGGIYITGATTLAATGAWTANAALDVEASGNISTGSLSTITVNTGLVKLNSTSGTVTIGANLQAPGPISLIGGTVTANANVIATASGQGILMKSRGGIVLADNVTDTNCRWFDGNDCFLDKQYRNFGIHHWTSTAGFA